MKFQEILRNLMSEKNLSQEKLGKLINLPTSTIANWFTRNSSPTVDNVACVADYFECSIDYLVGRELEDGRVIINCQGYEPQKSETVGKGAFMKLSKNLKELRTNTNLSQKKLGEKIKVSNASINSWENGINEPKASYLIALADFFGVTTDFLLGRENEAGIIEISGDRVIPEKSQIQKLYEKLNTRNQLRLICYGQGLFDGQ